MKVRAVRSVSVCQSKNLNKDIDDANDHDNDQGGNTDNCQCCFDLALMFQPPFLQGWTLDCADLDDSWLASCYWTLFALFVPSLFAHTW